MKPWAEIHLSSGCFCCVFCQWHKSNPCYLAGYRVTAMLHRLSPYFLTQGILLPSLPSSQNYRCASPHTRLLCLSSHVLDQADKLLQLPGRIWPVPCLYESLLCHLRPPSLYSDEYMWLSCSAESSGPWSKAFTLWSCVGNIWPMSSHRKSAWSIGLAEQWLPWGKAAVCLSVSLWTTNFKEA